MYILLMHGRGFVSSSIRFISRSEVSHAAILTDKGKLLESWPGIGVREKDFDFTDISGIEFYKVPLTGEQWEGVYQWYRSKIGEKYNYKGVFGYITRFAAPNPGKQFCSEILFDSIKRVGFPLLERVESFEVTPGDIRKSPLIYPEKDLTKIKTGV